MKQKFTLVLVITSFCFLKINTLKAQVNTQDSLALVDLYNSTNGPGWSNHTNWLTSAPLASWAGVTISANRVVELSLFGNGLSGNLPSSLGKLTNITYLELSDNKLIGVIPSSVGNLKSLEFLFIGANQLTGNIPPTIGKLLTLRGLNLSSNKLSGSIPPSLGNLININYLEINSNQLSGSIPLSFGKLINLSYLSLGDNQLSGNVSFLSDDLDSLRYLTLSLNQLSGNLLSLGNLTNLQYLDLGFNQFTGGIPVFRKLHDVNYFNLSYNQLSGTINHQFDSLTNNPNLFLILKSNRLTGKIPASLNILTDIYGLDLSNNQFSGTIPYLDSLTNLKFPNISNNQLTFAGMEKFVTTFPTATYAPQANIHITQNGNLLSVDAGGTTANNTYKWYRNGKLYRTKTGNATLTASNDGAFTVEVTNAVATQLTLKSDTVNYAALSNATTAAISNTIKPAYIFPNPATTIANVYFTASGKYTVTITDVSGKILQTKAGVAIANQNYLQLNIRNYQNGLYFITISDEKNNLQTLKLNKE